MRKGNIIGLHGLQLRALQLCVCHLPYYFKIQTLLQANLNFNVDTTSSVKRKKNIPKNITYYILISIKL